MAYLIFYTMYFAINRNKHITVIKFTAAYRNRPKKNAPQ